MLKDNRNTDSNLFTPIYIYFIYNGVTINEILIPNKDKSLLNLIEENSIKYKIPKEKFFEIVQQNKINLFELADKLENNLNNKKENDKIKSFLADKFNIQKNSSGMFKNFNNKVQEAYEKKDLSEKNTKSESNFSDCGVYSLKNQKRLFSPNSTKNMNNVHKKLTEINNENRKIKYNFVDFKINSSPIKEKYKKLENNQSKILLTSPNIKNKNFICKENIKNSLNILGSSDVINKMDDITNNYILNINKIKENNNFSKNFLENETNRSQNISEKSNLFLNLDTKIDISNQKSLIKSPNDQKKIFKTQTEAKSLLSYGERLYFKGKALEEENKKNLEKIKYDNDTQNKKIYTFKPKLNKNSLFTNLKNNLSKNQNFENENNTNPQKNILENTQSYNTKKQIIKVNSNPFLSGGNKSAINIEKSNIKSKEDIEYISKRLFSNAEVLKNKKNILSDKYYADICPFNPQIIRRDNTEAIKIDNFFSRLQNWVEKRNDRYESDFENTLIDQKTGKRYFSPQINKQKNDLAVNDSSKEKKYDNLYKAWDEKNKKIEEIKEKNLQEISSKANSSHVNEKSKHIIDEIQTKIFFKLFEILSDKNTNLITGKNMNMSEIPERIQNILMSLLNELNEQNETLNLDEFIMASKDLYVTLPLEFKLSLIEWYSSFNKNKKDLNLNFSFKPQINNYSRKIAEKSKMLCMNMYTKSIDMIKSGDSSSYIDKSKINNKSEQSKTGLKNLISERYSREDKIRETLEENNSEM